MSGRNPLWVADSVERVLGQEQEREGALDSPHRVEDGVDAVLLRRSGVEVEDDLGVAGGAEDRARLYQLAPEKVSVHQVPVVTDGDLFAYAGDSRLAIAHLILHGAKRDARIDWTAQVLHIVPVTPSQQSVLSVVVGPPTSGFDDGCDGASWGWRHTDRDSDGIPEIEIGPLQNDQWEILRRAVYRWADWSEQYEGPAGSVEEGFVRVDTQSHDDACCPYYRAIEEFALARHQLPTPGDPTAVRRSGCESVSAGSRQK